MLYSVAPDIGAFPFPDNVFVTIETAADGSGSVMGSQNVVSGSSIPGYAIQRNGSGNFIANVAGTWSLTNTTGGVQPRGPCAGEQQQECRFYRQPHDIGSSNITVSASGTSGMSSNLTVVPAAAATISVETAANGSGSVVNAQNVISGNSVTGFAGFNAIAPATSLRMSAPSGR